MLNSKETAVRACLALFRSRKLDLVRMRAALLNIASAAGAVLTGRVDRVRPTDGGAAILNHVAGTSTVDDKYRIMSRCEYRDIRRVWRNQATDGERLDRRLILRIDFRKARWTGPPLIQIRNRTT